ncbi:MAG: signal peptide peptidase SppA [Alphaproteobacteria bacterium]|nr:signal peptide peptidase SppA [Alphaproteobacteria bacterium]
MRRLGRAVLVVLAVFGALGLLLTAGGAVLLAKREPALPDRFVLALDLDEGVAEGTPDTPFGWYRMYDHVPIGDLIEALDRAATDPRVAALEARIGDAPIGMAQAEQIRRAVARFRQAKKPAYLFSPSFGGTVSYHIATAFDQVWLQPSGDLGLTGFVAETPFLRTALDSLGIVPVFSARHEYKSAPEIFTATDFSANGRETLDKLLTSWSERVIADIAERRGLKPEAVRAAIDNAPLPAGEARAAKLVDQLGYLDEMRTVLREAAGTAKPVSLRTYHAHREPPPSHARKIALIHGIGTVGRGESQFNSVADDAVMGAKTLTKAFADAAKDEDVAAIVFRVDSPGGDYVAADAIWREVKRAREKGKPVIVTMGNVAASGGYFVAMPANRIIAEPGTITGSIGVFAGKFVLRDFWNKLGVRWGEVHVGANAPMWSSNRDFTPEQRARFEAMLDTIYADFTAKAAAGRSLTLQQVDQIARGRVFSGTDALRVGLVDALGGLDTAVEEARKAAGILPDEPIRLTPFPSPKPFAELLAQALSGEELPIDLSAREARAALADLRRLSDTLKPLTRHLDAVGGKEGTLRAAPIDTR